MQKTVKVLNAAERTEKAERGRESSFLRTAKKSARRNAEALKELAKH
jgi:hypothetical protein